MKKWAVPLLVCFGLALLAGTPLFATDVAFWTETLDGPAAPTGWTALGDWQFGKPTGVTGDPKTGHTGNNVYGYNLTGPYGPNIAPPRYLTTTAIKCTGKYAVKLQFWRWLVVQDADYDQANLQVSNNNTTWTNVWVNSKDADHVDTSWTLVTYDISSVADNKATVYLRWGMASQSNKPYTYGGWNIDDLSLLAAGPTAIYSWNLTGAEPAGWVRDPHAPANAQPPAAGPGWQFGPAAVGTSGQNIGTPPVLTGADPAADADGVAGGNVYGYRIGANYYKGMSRTEYLTSPKLDCTGHTGTEVRFMRWLAVEDAAWDRACIQATNNNAQVTIFKDDFEAATITGWTFSGLPATGPTIWTGAGNRNDKQSVKFVQQQKMARTIDLTDYYAPLSLTFWMAADKLEAGDKVVAEYSLDGGTTWPDMVTLTANTAFAQYTVDLAALSPLVENKANFMVRFGIEGTAPDTDVDEAYLDDVVVKGVKWVTRWSNPKGPVGSPVDIFDTKWTQVSVPIGAVADGEDAVYIRFGMGPSDAFAMATEFGGWSLDNIQIVEGSRDWEVASTSAPRALLWETSGTVPVAVGARNDGTATWTSDYKLVEVIGPTEPVNRWNIVSKAVTGTVAPGATFNFSAAALAPPLTSIQYKTPWHVTWPADAEKSKLECNFNMANSAGFFLSRTLTGEIIYAKNGVVTRRFPDILPGTDGAWADFYTEELLGRVPYIVMGFPSPIYPNGVYGPLVVVQRDAIAVYIQRAANIPKAAYQGLFRDVPSGFWAALEIEACASSTPAIVQGYPDFTYRPTDIIPRDAMAKLITLGVIVSGNGLIVTVPPYPTTQPFSDVYVVDDPTKTPPIVKNPFAAYILALKNAAVVEGYPDGTYRPSVTITRDLLAAYVWRAFIRNPATAVVLGGPAVTKINPNPAVTSWVGYPSTAMAQGEDQNYAYAVFDAARMGAAMLMNGTWDVKFELRNLTTPTVPAPAGRTGLVKVPTATFNAAIATARATGDPYFTTYWPIPTGLQGRFVLVTSVGNVSGTMTEALRKPAYTVVNRIFYDDFEAGIDPSYQVLGLPSGGPLWWDKDPKNGTHSLEFTGTQKLARSVDTTGFYNLSLVVWLGGTKLTSTDHLVVEWSKDAGLTWTTAVDLTNHAGPDTKLTKYTAALPAAAENNPNFRLRFGMDAGTDVTKKGYVDDLEIRGS